MVLVHVLVQLGPEEEDVPQAQCHLLLEADLGLTIVGGDHTAAADQAVDLTADPGPEGGGSGG